MKWPFEGENTALAIHLLFVQALNNIAHKCYTFLINDLQHGDFASNYMKKLLLGRKLKNCLNADHVVCLLSIDVSEKKKVELLKIAER